MLCQQVGTPKYIHKQRYDFDLNNALYARPDEYDSLHDPFLRGYFDKPRTKRLLVHNDLITKDGKVKCDIKEFNRYRSVTLGNDGSGVNVVLVGGGGTRGWGCSSVGRASDRHAADAGSTSRCGKGIFSQSPLSVQTLLRCPYTPVRNRMHLYLCAR